jgi:uncharacterized Zn-finger protein
VAEGRRSLVEVLGIVGSPRRGGNTDVLVERVLAGAHGLTTEKVLLGELEISPCRACYSCADSGRCVIEDDFPALLERVLDSEGIVLGSPMYVGTVTAQGGPQRLAAGGGDRGGADPEPGHVGLPEEGGGVADHPRPFLPIAGPIAVRGQACPCGIKEERMICGLIIGDAGSAGQARELARSFRDCPYCAFVGAFGNRFVWTLFVPESHRWWLESIQVCV